jgi:SWI/SNF-related matrix-associated actin-dependent regulator of chromatin subfamily B protein 1
VISPEHFAQTVVEDYNLAPTYHGVITKSIQDQLSDFRAHSANYDGDSWDLAVTEDTLRAGTLEGESAAWWSAWRKRLRTEYGFVRAPGRGKGHKQRKVEKEDDDMDAADERPMLVEEFTFDQKALHDDMRILIRVSHPRHQCAGTRHTHDAAARHHCWVDEA